jgi:hypothetical protein
MEDGFREEIYDKFESLNDTVQALLEENNFYDSLQNILDNYPVSSFIPNLDSFLGRDSDNLDKTQKVVHQAYSIYEVALIYLNDYFKEEDSSYLDAFFKKVEEAYQNFPRLENILTRADIDKANVSQLFSFRYFLSTLIAHQDDIKQGLERLKLSLFHPEDDEFDERLNEYAIYLHEFDTALKNKKICKAELLAGEINNKKAYMGLNLDEVKSNLFSIFDRYSYLGDIPHAKDKYKHLERTIKELE